MCSKPALVAFASLLILPSAAGADGFHAPRLKQGPVTSIQSYARQNPRCAEWTNGCVVCLATNGHAQCSTPGIACTPAGLTCKRSVEP